MLCFQLQPLKLLLVKRICRQPHRKDYVEVVAFLLHPVLVKIAAGLHSDESRFQQRVDTFHRSVLCQICCGGDGVVTGVTGVRPPVLD